MESPEKSGEVGSPPLAREPQRLGARALIDDGITPARAGTTYYKNAKNCTYRDHPRSRGNHFFISRHLSGLRGSPPLAREPRSAPSGTIIFPRITPARAGTTSRSSSPSSRRRDHPRSRGNHATSPAMYCFRLGSPPLAREPLLIRRHGDVQLRITPARAGTTPASSCPQRGNQDHPRSRGNHL